jgi:hypothetical protein
LSLPTLSDQYKISPFDVAFTITAIKTIGINKTNSSTTENTVSNNLFIAILNLNYKRVDLTIRTVEKNTTLL